MHLHIFELEILVLLFKIFYIRIVTQIFFWCFFLSLILFFFSPTRGNICCSNQVYSGWWEHIAHIKVTGPAPEPYWIQQGSVMLEKKKFLNKMKNQEFRQHWYFTRRIVVAFTISLLEKSLVADSAELKILGVFSSIDRNRTTCWGKQRSQFREALVMVVCILTRIQETKDLLRSGAW